MTRSEKYDKVITGIVAGFILPFIVGLIIFLFTSHNQSMKDYIDRIIESRIITHSITLCVFPNIIIFLISNRFDMLRASKGILAVTIFWALIVFGVKFI
jgi:hypothetical protein